MAENNFNRCHEVTAKWEGGWSNHPKDPGGATMYGVTQAVYDSYKRMTGRPTKSVRYITHEEALAIYKTNYWFASGSNRLHEGVDLAHYDAAVNSGTGRAKKLLAASIGDADPSKTVKKYCAKRLSFVRGLKTWSTFGKGWSRRIADIEAKGVAWALAASVGPVAAKKQLETEAGKAATTSDLQKVGGAGAATSGGGAAAVQDQLAASVILAIFVAAALAIAFLVWRSRVNRDRAAAYAEEAMKI